MEVSVDSGEIVPKFIDAMPSNDASFRIDLPQIALTTTFMFTKHTGWR